MYVSFMDNDVFNAVARPYLHLRDKSTALRVRKLRVTTILKGMPT